MEKVGYLGTPIEIATRKGNIRVLKFYQNKCQVDLSKVKTSKNENLVYLASKYGHIFLLQYLKDLLNQKESNLFQKLAEKKSDDGFSSLTKCLSLKKFVCADFLLNNGCSHSSTIQENEDIFLFAFNNN